MASAQACLPSSPPLASPLDTATPRPPALPSLCPVPPWPQICRCLPLSLPGPPAVTPFVTTATSWRRVSFPFRPSYGAQVNRYQGNHVSLAGQPERRSMRRPASAMASSRHQRRDPAPSRPSTARSAARGTASPQPQLARPLAVNHPPAPLRCHPRGGGGGGGVLAWAVAVCALCASQTCKHPAVVCSTLMFCWSSRFFFLWRCPSRRRKAARCGLRAFKGVQGEQDQPLVLRLHEPSGGQV